MAQLVLAIAGGSLVGVIAFAVLALAGWAAGTMAGYSFSFHSGISGLWLALVPAVQLGSGIAASWSASRFYRRRSWSAPVGASIGLAAMMALPFLRAPAPMFVWLDLVVVAVVPGIIVGAMARQAK
jgi:hypothetical protein